MKLSRYEYRVFLLYLGAGALIFFSDRALPLLPLGFSLTFAFSLVGLNPFLLAGMHVASSVFTLDLPHILTISILNAVVSVIFFVYKKKNAKMGMESAIYLIFCFLPFVFYGKTGLEGAPERILYAVLTVLFSYVSAVFFLPLFRKKTRFSPRTVELLAGGAVLFVCSTGIYRVLGGVWLSGAATFSLLLFSYFFHAEGALFSAAFSLPSVLLYGDFSEAGAFLLIAAVCCALQRTNRYLAACFPAPCFLALSLWLRLLEFSYPRMVAFIAASLLFVLIPSSLLKKGETMLSAHREKTLTRAALNRDHALVSAKMMNLAAVFREIEGLFSRSAEKPDEASDSFLLAGQILESVCVHCRHYPVCRKEGGCDEYALQKAAAIGTAKGNLTLSDFPEIVLDNCMFPNNLLFGANQILARYLEQAEDRKNAEVGRKLVGAEAGGVAEVLENLSRSYAAPYLFDRKRERTLFELLAEKGIFPEEIMVQTDGVVSAVLQNSEIDRLSKVTACLSRAVGKAMVPAEAQDADPDRKMVTFRPAPLMDAAFGVASAKKDGSARSGDTYSMLRLGVNGFLVALSDGMGSGEEAGEVSSAAMTLIESFYRAGFCSDVVLSTVNKLLSVRAEETFSAVDIATVSLQSGRCDFIKIGAPYGFVLKKEGVSVIPGNSLPLGILEDVRPEVFSDTLRENDVIVLFSDGISDAFSSSSDFLDFLAKAKERNPQELADRILREAKLRTGGVAADDMTVLCLRLFRRQAPSAA